eukprot:TRINITY_DN121863_c0_g1_i1.p1 TRINITY_DN121863_c0_g1~~TRINITY_DN121863_c0_g1_i1.p1  ORF type:complete len:838 (-),score=241.70 TRINITY_DN121863_c0_g1_i1:259-2772(-)
MNWELRGAYALSAVWEKPELPAYLLEALVEELRECASKTKKRELKEKEWTWISLGLESKEADEVDNACEALANGCYCDVRNQDALVEKTSVLQKLIALLVPKRVNRTARWLSCCPRVQELAAMAITAACRGRHRKMQEAFVAVDMPRNAYAFRLKSRSRPASVDIFASPMSPMSPLSPAPWSADSTKPGDAEDDGHEIPDATKALVWLLASEVVATQLAAAWAIVALCHGLPSEKGMKASLMKRPPHAWHQDTLAHVPEAMVNLAKLLSYKETKEHRASRLWDPEVDLGIGEEAQKPKEVTREEGEEGGSKDDEDGKDAEGAEGSQGAEAGEASGEGGANPQDGQDGDGKAEETADPKPAAGDKHSKPMSETPDGGVEAAATASTAPQVGLAEEAAKIAEASPGSEDATGEAAAHDKTRKKGAEQEDSDDDIDQMLVPQLTAEDEELLNAEEGEEEEPEEDEIVDPEDGEGVEENADATADDDEQGTEGMSEWDRETLRLKKLAKTRPKMAKYLDLKRRRAEAVKRAEERKKVMEERQKRLDVKRAKKRAAYVERKEKEQEVAEALHETSEKAQLAAVWTIYVGCKGHPAFKDALAEADEVLAQFAGALGRRDDAMFLRVACQTISEACQGPHEDFQYWFGEAPNGLENLAKVVAYDEDPEVQKSACEAMASLCYGQHKENQDRFSGIGEALNNLVDCLASEDPYVGQAAARTISTMCEGPHVACQNALSVVPQVSWCLAKLLTHENAVVNASAKAILPWILLPHRPATPPPEPEPNPEPTPQEGSEADAEEAASRRGSMTGSVRSGKSVTSAKSSKGGKSGRASPGVRSGQQTPVP